MERLTKRTNGKYNQVKGCPLFYKAKPRKNAAIANAVARLAAYEDTGVSPKELQDVVDLFTEATVSGVDIPKELKRWMERCTWHVRKCVELGEKLRSTVEEANFFHKNYEAQVSERIRMERKLRKIGRAHV